TPHPPSSSTPLQPQSEEMWWGTLGSVRPFPNFRPERDIAEVQAALEVKDVQTLVRILTNRSYAQRQSLAAAYQKLIEKDLVAGLKRVLSGDLETLILGLMLTPEQFEAQRLYQAMKGLGTDEDTVLEILCVRTPQQLSAITATYNEKYKRDLEKDLVSETSGNFAKLVVALLKTLSEELNNKKADPAPWIRILTSRQPTHLNRVLSRLECERGQAVEKALEGRFGGDLRLGLTTLVHCIKNPDQYLAQRIKTMKAAIVQGVMISHSEEDMLRVRVAYLKVTGTSLYTALQEKFKGDYLQALLAICRAED
ncbi:annexin A2, partial [Chanos chanos]|uniref:Annexin n=1 Tax=Chanos chanos TaxID=29144 RepID=A0A6J2WL85_CHACN